MISKLKIAQSLKRDIIKNIYLLSVYNSEDYKTKILKSLNEYAKRFEIEKKPLQFSIEFLWNSLDFTYDKSGQLTRFLKSNKLSGSFEENTKYTNTMLIIDKILYDYLKTYSQKTENLPYFSKEIFENLELKKCLES